MRNLLNIPIRNVLVIVVFLLSIKAFSQDTTFYNLNWEEVDPLDARYYRVISKLDSLWSINDYFISNEIQMTGTLNKPDHLARHGNFKWYNKDGGLVQTGQYINGQKNGELVFYYDNGQIQAEENYLNGVPHGPANSYYSNGQKEAIAIYNNGILSGIVENWYENGQLKSHAEFNDGARTGKWTFYNEGGNITEDLLFELKFEIIKEKLFFEIPNQEWYRDKFINNNNIEWHSFARNPIENENGIKIFPNISFLIEDASSMNDVILFSAQKRRNMPFNVDEVFTHENSNLQLKNAVGYLGNTIYDDGSKHTVLVVHALAFNKGIQIIMDMTSDIYEDYGHEFIEALSGIYEN